MLAVDDEYTWDDAFAAEVRRVRLLSLAEIAAGRRKKKPKRKKRRRKAKAAKRRAA